MKLEKKYDFIVVGAGPCGLLSASILTKKGSCLVIDEGNLIDSSQKNHYSFKQIQEGYRDGGFNMVLGLPKIFLSEGCCIGGGSIVNSALHHRAPDSVWNLWRTEYNLVGFEKKDIDNAYQKIETDFATDRGNSIESNFYKTASKKFSVKRIPRWGEGNSLGDFRRKTAYDAYENTISENGGHIQGGVKYHSAYKKNETWIVKLLIQSQKKIISIQCKFLILAMGAGYTPIALHKLGLRHKNLGRFQIHPTARISILQNQNLDSINVVEPFQITQFFPHLMIGSSAKRYEISKAFYPLKNDSNINFNNVQNLYSMAPSTNKGFILFNKFFRGIKIYNLDNSARERIKFGLRKIIEIASSQSSVLVFHQNGILLRKNFSNEEKINKFIKDCINSTLSSVHIFSSAPSGENKSLCPVDSFGLIEKYKNLLVIDSSLIPSCPTVNPQATALVFSYLNTVRLCDKF